MPAYANPGFIRGSGFLRAGIECEFDERDEPMQRLIFGKFAERLAAGEIVRTVLNCDPQCSVRHCGCDRSRSCRTSAHCVKS